MANRDSSPLDSPFLQLQFGDTSGSAYATPTAASDAAGSHYLVHGAIPADTPALEPGRDRLPEHSSLVGVGYPRLLNVRHSVATTQPSVYTEDSTRHRTDAPFTETTPLLQQSQLVDGSRPTTPNQPLPDPNRWWKNSKNVLCAVITIILSIVLLMLNGILLSLIKESVSTSAPVYADDVVHIRDVEGFWYDRITITYKAPSDTDIPADFEIYYTDNSNAQQEISNFTSLPHTFSFPEGILVQQSLQVYLLHNSGIEFDFTVVNESEFAESAKVCQFSNLDDYDALLQAKTNESIVKAERNGDCQPILASPNMFQIEHDGYYWYAVSTLLGTDTVNVEASYTYILSRWYYDRTTLGQPHDCTLTNYKCIIRGITFQTSTKQVFVFVSNSESSEPYTFNVKASHAFGIAVVVFILAELITVVFCVCMCICIWRCRK